MHGSSPKCGAALATVGSDGEAQNPAGMSSSLAAPQRLGQSMQVYLIIGSFQYVQFAYKR
jgi:hypothetical protein